MYTLAVFVILRAPDQTIFGLVFQPTISRSAFVGFQSVSEEGVVNHAMHRYVFPREGPFLPRPSPKRRLVRLWLAVVVLRCTILAGIWRVVVCEAVDARTPSDHPPSHYKPHWGDNAMFFGCRGNFSLECGLEGSSRNITL